MQSYEFFDETKKNKENSFLSTAFYPRADGTDRQFRCNNPDASIHKSGDAYAINRKHLTNKSDASIHKSGDVYAISRERLSKKPGMPRGGIGKANGKSRFSPKQGVIFTKVRIGFHENKESFSRR